MKQNKRLAYAAIVSWFSDRTNRSMPQTSFLFDLLKGDIRKLKPLEDTIKLNHVSYCPENETEVKFILDMNLNRIREHHKLGNVVLLNNSLLAQSFETKDQVLKCIAERIGGGFTMGITLHEVFKNEKSITSRETLPSDNLDKIYKYFSDYCDQNFL